MDERRYNVTYSRLMASGHRLTAKVEMPEDRIAELFMNESKFKYIVILCELINPNWEELRSLPIQEVLE